MFQDIIYKTNNNKFIIRTDKRLNGLINIDDEIKVILDNKENIEIVNFDEVENEIMQINDELEEDKNGGKMVLFVNDSLTPKV